jgi:hypothetical protein
VELIDWLTIAHTRVARTVGNTFGSLIPTIKSQKNVSIGCPGVPGKQKFYVLPSRECGCARHYLSSWGFLESWAENRWAPDDIFFEIAFACGEQGCGLPIRTYVHTTTTNLLATTARDLLLKARLKPYCNNGHILTDEATCTLAREVFSLWPLD